MYDIHMKASFWDIIDGIAYGIKKKFPSTKLMKPIAVKDPSLNKFVIGFLYNDSMTVRPTKLMFEDANGKYAISIDEKEWEDAAAAWIKENKPCSAFAIPDIVDIRNAVKLCSNTQDVLAKKFLNEFSKEHFTLSLVDVTDEFMPTPLFYHSEVINSNDCIEQWMIEKDLAQNQDEQS